MSKQFTALPLDAIEKEMALIGGQVERAMVRINRVLRSIGYYWFSGKIDATRAAELMNAASEISPYHKAAVVAFAQAACGLHWSDEKKTLYGHTDQKLSESNWRTILEKDFREFKKPQSPEAWVLSDQLHKLLAIAQKKVDGKKKAAVAPVIPLEALDILKRAAAEIDALAS